jgi:hypothetical protein
VGGGKNVLVSSAGFSIPKVIFLTRTYTYNSLNINSNAFTFEARQFAAYGFDKNRLVCQDIHGYAKIQHR